jgi:hypothetical protein
VLARAQTREECTEEIVSFNRSLGSPADIRINVSFPQVARLVRQAGIYLSTHSLSAPYGMPISIAESMATGGYVVARRCPASEAYVGAAGSLYDTLDEAAALIRETVPWDQNRWQQVQRAAVDHAWSRHVDSIVLPPLLDEWLQIAGAAAKASAILPFPRPSGVAGADEPNISSFRLVA